MKAVYRLPMNQRVSREAPGKGTTTLRCTGRTEDGVLKHDGPTCPIHERKA